MTFVTSFKIGQEVTNNQIINEFLCGNMGGMRRSKKTNTLILISDNTKSLYEDIWKDDVLLYTGMGKKGDQELVSQNRNLAESNTNGIELHLFEVFKPKVYTYLGKVELCNDPYIDEQKDENQIFRKVWIFPLKILSAEGLIDLEKLNYIKKLKENKTKKMSLYQLEQRAIENEGRELSIRETKCKIFIRNTDVAELARRYANGVCDLCGMDAPFKDKQDSPYLEAHHIEWLSKNGIDDITNVVALCPNCHKKMHILDLKEDVEKLKKVITLRS